MSTLGLDMVLSVVFGVLGGRWLDGRYDLAPWLTLVGLFFGVLAAARFFLRAKRRLERQTAEDGFDERRLDRPARYALDEERRRR
jgi:F0F1-type ATP synthase assembly protein I